MLVLLLVVHLLSEVCYHHSDPDLVDCSSEQLNIAAIKPIPQIFKPGHVASANVPPSTNLSLNYQLEKCVFLSSHYMTQVLKLSRFYGVNDFAFLLRPIQDFGISDPIGPGDTPYSAVAPHFEGLQFVHVVFLQSP